MEEQIVDIRTVLSSEHYPVQECSTSSQYPGGKKEEHDWRDKEDGPAQERYQEAQEDGGDGNVHTAMYHLVAALGVKGDVLQNS